MAWIVLFIVSQIILVLLIDWKTLKINIWNGVLAIFLQILVDTKSISMKSYVINDPVIPVLGSSLFFILGPVWVIGVLMAQYYPAKKWLLILHPIVLAILYTLQEMLLVSVKALAYMNWDIYISLGVNALVMVTLSWFCSIVLNKGGVSH